MDNKRWGLDAMSETIQAVMKCESMNDQQRHDVMRLIEKLWSGRGTSTVN